MKNSKGITLIALVITIIIMLILAGVVLSITLEENGLFKITKYAVQKNSEETAKEKLELALADLASYKYTDETYNENEYINNYLKNEEMTVVDNIVTVDKWNFEIDRSIPSIKANLGESEVKITKEVKEYLGKNANDKYEVSVLVKIESKIKIESVEFENTDGTILIAKVEKETLAKDMQIELDREYKITIKMENGKTVNKTIIENSVENIRTVEELIAFRDKVNRGKTFEGKTVQLMNDIDLSSICGEEIGSWIPIGAPGLAFKGTFDGENHVIKNMYFKDSLYRYVGLFAVNKGNIQNVVLENVYIYNTYNTVTSWSYSGGIAGSSSGNIVNCGIHSGSIAGISTSGSTVQSWGIVLAGGITGYNSGLISNSYNKATITSQNVKQSHNSAYSAGITAYSDGQIYNCYNAGTMNATGYYILSAGVAGYSRYRNI